MNKFYVGVFSIGIAIMCIALSLGVGSVSFAPFEILNNPTIWQLRASRVALGFFAGSAMAVSGVVFQALLQNPLADSYVVGVSGGAALGGVLAIALGSAGALALPLWSFLGAIVATLLLLSLLRAHKKTDPFTILLVGVIFNAFAAAVITVLKTTVSANRAQEILFWLVGVLDFVPLQTLVPMVAYVVTGSVFLFFCGGALNLLALGDEQAGALGLNVTRYRLVVFLAAALLVGATVATSGMIGFVGLVVPHVLRRILGGDHRVLLPISFVFGGSFLVICDTFSRLSFLWIGTEIPVGAITALCGGPFFIWLLLRNSEVSI